MVFVSADWRVGWPVIPCGNSVSVCDWEIPCPPSSTFCKPSGTFVDAAGPCLPTMRHDKYTKVARLTRIQTCPNKTRMDLRHDMGPRYIPARQRSGLITLPQSARDIQREQPERAPIVPIASLGGRRLCAAHAMHAWLMAGDLLPHSTLGAIIQLYSYSSSWSRSGQYLPG